MKLLLTVSLCIVCLPAFAPTGHIYGTWPGEYNPGKYGYRYLPPTPPNPPVVAPVKPPEPEPWQLRIVDGTCYNVMRSVKWARLIPKAPMSVAKILPDGVLFTIHEQVLYESSGSASVVTTRYASRVTKNYDSSAVAQVISLPPGSCFVRNFPDGELLTEGERISPHELLVMRVLPFKYEGKALPTFDCGVQAPPLVTTNAVVKK